MNLWKKAKHDIDMLHSACGGDVKIWMGVNAKQLAEAVNTANKIDDNKYSSPDYGLIMEIHNNDISFKPDITYSNSSKIDVQSMIEAVEMVKAKFLVTVKNVSEKTAIEILRKGADVIDKVEAWHDFLFWKIDKVKFYYHKNNTLEIRREA